jgi:hypothetical protein
MPGMIDRINEIATNYYKGLPLDIERFNTVGDASIIVTHRYLAVADYVATHDPKVFRDNIYKSVEYEVKLYERFEVGEDISWSYLDEDSYKYLWNALCSGDFSISHRLMEHIYKHNMDLSNASAFDRYFNYMFQVSILDIKFEENIFQEMYEIFQKKYKSYAGYALAFESIYKKDAAAFDNAFEIVMKGHRVLCRRGAEFGDSEDEIIAIWPLGLINLARMKGMDVTVDDSLVPKDLLADVIRNKK